MAKAPATDWIKQFRAQLRSVTSSGWFVRPDNHDRARLVVQREGHPAQTVGLGVAWNRSESGKILSKAQQLYELVRTRAVDLRTAMRLLEQSNTGNSTSWEEAIEGFRLRMASNVKPVTWAKYAEVLKLVEAKMTGPRPAATGAELIEAVVSKWKPGCRRRQQAVQQVSRFLRYRVEMLHLPDCWLAPSDTTELIGVNTETPDPDVVVVGNKVTHLQDEEILALLDSFPDTEPGRRWADCIRLMAELGIRPHELQFLSVRTDPSTGEAYWHCRYEKRAGKGARTDQRRLLPLPIAGTKWNLMERWQLGDIKLPRLSGGNGAADSIRHYLRRRPRWKELEAIYATRGENIAVYSFRNTFCLRANRLGVPVASVAKAMGNTPEVLQAKYSWGDELVAEAHFRAALARRDAGTA